MLTNPNTLGVFDENIAEITRLVRDAGGTLYYDGANLNAIMGHTPARRHGVRHRPRQPPQVVLPAARRRRARRRADRGLGSDRAVPAGAAARAHARAPTAPRRRFDFDYERPKSIGRLRGFAGNFGVFVRSYAYIRSLGGDGLTEASETAVLNANYLLRPAAARAGRAGTCRSPSTASACTSSSSPGAPAKRELGVKTLDVAKRLLDFGFHPPTIYFPLLVDEALMVEPTETETREGLDALAEAFEEILAEAESDPEIARNAPYTTPVRRLDEAARAAGRSLRQPLAAAG